MATTYLLQQGAFLSWATWKCDLGIEITNFPKFGDGLAGRACRCLGCQPSPRAEKYCEPGRFGSRVTVTMASGRGLPHCVSLLFYIALLNSG